MPIIQTERGKTGGTSSKSIINTLVSSLGTYQSQGPPKSQLTGEAQGVYWRGGLMNDEGEEGTYQKIISGQNTVHYISYKLLPKFRMLLTVSISLIENWPKWIKIPLLKTQEFLFQGEGEGGADETQGGFCATS